MKSRDNENRLKTLMNLRLS